MKRLYFLIILFSVVFYSYAQDVQFQPSIIPAGGGVETISGAHVSKWRIGRVNALYVNTKDEKSTVVVTPVGDVSVGSWEIQAYPNPVIHHLNLRFEMENPIVISIELKDISGRKVLHRKKQLIYPNENVQLDLLEFPQAMYLVHVLSEDKTLNKVFKISKQ